jgi:hypothetical protein
MLTTEAMVTSIKEEDEENGTATRVEGAVR